jgi:hypothetical protein
MMKEDWIMNILHALNSAVYTGILVLIGIIHSDPMAMVKPSVCGGILHYVGFHRKTIKKDNNL